MWLAGHLWHQNSHCKYEYDYERILIRNNFHFSKVNVRSLLIFFAMENKEKFSEHSHFTFQ